LQGPHSVPRAGAIGPLEPRNDRYVHVSNTESNASQQKPFIMGPNVIFAESSRPRRDELEALILDATSCEAIFCHSLWYRDLIRAYLGPQNHAQLWCWPYPIRPLPGPPEARPELDVLIYVKSGPNAERLAVDVAAKFSNARIVRHGEYRRSEFFHLARRSRACLYLSNDESGGLATQELMLAGCPVVGIEQGAPLVEHGATGIRVDSWSRESFLHGLGQCLELDRNEVYEAATRTFDEEAIALRVIGHLDEVRRRVI